MLSKPRVLLPESIQPITKAERRALRRGGTEHSDESDPRLDRVQLFISMISRGAAHYDDRAWAELNAEHSGGRATVTALADPRLLECIECIESSA